jgi:hypothetical protein
MRALILTAGLLTLLSSYPLLAQDQGKPPVDAAQPVQPGSSAPAKQNQQSSSNDQTGRTLNRMGPGIDWDHRKPGRHWRISPHHPGT